MNKIVSTLEYLYVIGDRKKTVCRFGTSYDVMETLREFQRTYPHPLEIMYERRFLDARDREQHFRNTLQKYELKGGWYDIQWFYETDWSSISTL